MTPRYLAGGEDYAISVERVPLAEPQPLIATGHLPDAWAIAALYMARNFLKEKAK